MEYFVHITKLGISNVVIEQSEDLRHSLVNQSQTSAEVHATLQQPTTCGEGADDGRKKTAIGLFEDDDNYSRQIREEDLALLSMMKPIDQRLQDYIREQARGKK